MYDILKELAYDEIIICKVKYLDKLMMLDKCNNEVQILILFKNIIYTKL